MAQNMYSTDGVAAAMGAAMGAVVKAGETIVVVCADGAMVMEMTTDFVCRRHFAQRLVALPATNLFQ